MPCKPDAKYKLSGHLLVQSQKWKHQKNKRILFNVNKIYTPTLMTSFWCLLTDFARCSGVSIAEFEQVNAT